MSGSRRSVEHTWDQQYRIMASRGVSRAWTRDRAASNSSVRTLGSADSNSFPEEATCCSRPGTSSGALGRTATEPLIWESPLAAMMNVKSKAEIEIERSQENLGRQEKNHISMGYENGEVLCRFLAPYRNPNWAGAGVHPTLDPLIPQLVGRNAVSKLQGRREWGWRRRWDLTREARRILAVFHARLTRLQALSRGVEEAKWSGAKTRTCVDASSWPGYSVRSTE